METLEWSLENRVATIYLNRPPVNALNRRLFEELYELLEEIESNDEVKAVVLTAKGDRAFAAGADIREMADLDARGMEQMNRLSRRTFDMLENLSKPVIAGINGLALGGGCELALCCDFRICSEHAKIGLPEITLAIMPGGGGTQRLQRLIGQAKAKEMLYFGDVVSADEAYRIGLVNRVVPHEKLLETCAEWAEKLAAKPAVALRMIKRSVNAGANLDLCSALTFEAACFGNVFATEDRKEGMAAFVEKRKPVFADR